MLFEFTKMNGAGNDFILFDNRGGAVTLSAGQIVRLCDRHAGVGADGLIGLIPGAWGRGDWGWQFHNSDGSEAEMCGNGARCFARYIQQVTGGPDRFTFETVAGIIGAHVDGERVTVDLTAPAALRLNESLALKSGAEAVHSLDTGVPHAVVYVPDADQAMVSDLGREIRFHPHFAPRGTNVNFVQVLGPDRIRVRTYERGVEGETLACGTGVTAAALISSRLHGFRSPVHVRVQGGGELAVTFQTHGEDFRDVQLTGPADFVFPARIEI